MKADEGELREGTFLVLRGIIGAHATYKCDGSLWERPCHGAGTSKASIQIIVPY